MTPELKLQSFTRQAMADGKPAASEKRAEIYTHESDSPVYSMNWSVRLLRYLALLSSPVE